MESWWSQTIVQPFEQFVNGYQTSSNRRSTAACKSRESLATRTGLCNLERHLNHRTFPRYIIDLRERCKVIDVSDNEIETVPNEVNELVKCTKFVMMRNSLQTMPRTLNMVTLKVLNVSHNKLKVLSALELPNLIELVCDGNEIQELPSMNKLKKLEIFSASDNMLTDVTALSVCFSLAEVDLRRNRLGAIPSEFAFLRNIRRLRLDGNKKIKTIEKDVFLNCVHLEELTMKDTAVMAEDLRSVEGFAEYDNRRQRKVDKKIKGRVMLENCMDDGLERKV